tara:strand:+ start:188 stop:883 length:696 start_codon:yes stop_codon:yes gene_type:complete
MPAYIKNRSGSSSSSSSSGCGWNPFCHIGQLISCLCVFCIIGVIINIWGFGKLGSRNKEPVKWDEDSYKEKEKIVADECCIREKCTCPTTYGLSDGEYGKECCKALVDGGEICDSDIVSCNCIEKMIPCVNCTISKKYNVSGGEGSWTDTVKKTKCDFVDESDTPRKLWADKRNPNDYSTMSTQSEKTIATTLIVIWWCILIMCCIGLYLSYNAFKSASSAVVSVVKEIRK